MEKKYKRGEVVKSNTTIVLVTGDRSEHQRYFSGVCIGNGNGEPTYPIGDFSTTWHSDKFKKTFDNLEDWMKSK